MGKYVKHLSNEELLARMADDLVQMHFETGIDLAYWETGFELVSRFYHTGIEATVGDKKNA